MYQRSPNFHANVNPSESVEESGDINSEREEHCIQSGIAVDDTNIEIAVLFINFQNEFCHDSGKLHSLAKTGMEKNETLSKAADLAKVAR